MYVYIIVGHVIPLPELKVQALSMLEIVLNSCSNLDWEAYSSSLDASKPGDTSFSGPALEPSIARKMDNLLLQIE